ncbi:MAG: hypothetical protein H0V07_01915 [Propionibacteriales bacterium]|nr:hypothetical protein [Propionibacteriales bacterium]
MPSSFSPTGRAHLLGNRSNASSEIEMDEAWAQRVGEAGRGVRMVMQMLTPQRLENIVWSTAPMRQAVSQAIWHGDHRSAFGARLVDQPVMTPVLADLALEAEAGTAVAMRPAAALDRSGYGTADAERDSHDALVARPGIAVAKYWVCKRTPAHIVEALGCDGGIGFVEESIMPRLYRDVPLHTIWEGSGNVLVLDVLRAMKKPPPASTRSSPSLISPPARTDTPRHRGGPAAPSSPTPARWSPAHENWSRRWR